MAAIRRLTLVCVFSLLIFGLVAAQNNNNQPSQPGQGQQNNGNQQQGKPNPPGPPSTGQAAPQQNVPKAPNTPAAPGAPATPTAPAAPPAPQAPQKPYVDNSGKNFSLDNLPKKWQDDQTGTNDCKQWGSSSQDSMCQTAYINSVNDFCLFAPPQPGLIGDTEREEVSWCLKPGYGTRLIPDGTFTAVHFIKTPAYVQVIGLGNLTTLNIMDQDLGGELDPHGADGNGNPIGGLVFSNAYGSYQQIHEWTNFMSFNEFCFRACVGTSDTAKAQCQHIYDTLGCHWNMPGDYTNPGFDSCLGDVGEPPGVYGTSTFHNGDAVTPDAHTPAPFSQCTPIDKINYAYTLPGQPPPQAPAAPGNKTSGSPSSPPGSSGSAGKPSNHSTGAPSAAQINAPPSRAAISLVAFVASAALGAALTF